MSDWAVSTLADVAEIGAGNSAPQDERLFKDGVHPFIRTSDVGQIRFGSIATSADLLNEEGIQGLRLFPKGTILMPKSGASTFLNHRVEMAEDSYVSSHLATVYARPNVCDGRFLLYYLSTVRAQDLIQDHKYPSLTLRTIGEILVPLPPLDEQKCIVAVLDQAFSALDRARANAEANLTVSADIPEAWLQGLFEGSEAWPMHALADICENLDRLRVPITKGDREPGDTPYYGASGVVDHVKGHLFDEDLLLVSEDGANLLARTYPIAFSISGRSWVNNHAHVLRFEDSTTQEYVRLYLNSISLEPYVTGMAQPKLNQGALNAIPVPMPSVEAREQIVGKAHEISVKVDLIAGSYRTQLDEVAALRQSLLKAAFSGQLT